jgi:DNA-directed RNA polymerase subunit RPC12/RpoP
MSTKHLSKFASNISSFFLHPCGTPPSPETSKSQDQIIETERRDSGTMAPTTRRRSSRIRAAEINTQSQPADGERMNEDTVMRDTEMLPPTSILDTERDTAMQDTKVPPEPSQSPVIGTDWKPGQGSSVSHTIEKAISALHREDEAEDEEKSFHRSSNSKSHDSNSGGSINSEDMDKRASTTAPVVQTRKASMVAHEELSSSESDEDEDAQTADKRKRERREREREREREINEGIEKNANANGDMNVNEISTTMPIPPPRSLTSTAPLPGSDLLRSLNVSNYRVNISPHSSSSYTPAAPALSLPTTTAPPSSYKAPQIKYGTYRCAGTYQYREVVTIDGIEQYSGSMIPVNCGIEFQIKLGTRRNELGQLENAEPFRCKVCRCRMIYKVRTNQMVQFEAR